MTDQANDRRPTEWSAETNTQEKQTFLASFVLALTFRQQKHRRMRGRTT